jgi:hypothetical protein
MFSYLFFFAMILYARNEGRASWSPIIRIVIPLRTRTAFVGYCFWNAEIFFVRPLCFFGCVL